MLKEKVRVIVFVRMPTGWTHNSKLYRDVLIESDGSYDAVSAAVEKLVKIAFAKHEVLKTGWQYI